MTGEEHYREAERLVVADDVHEPPTLGNIELAQVHALLALAAQAGTVTLAEATQEPLADRDRETLHRIGFEVGLWQGGAVSAPHGPSGLAGHITMTCLVGLGGCVDTGCACRCHEFPGWGEPVCGATNTALGLTCNRRPHPPGTSHYQLDDNGLRAWPAGEPTP